MRLADQLTQQPCLPELKISVKAQPTAVALADECRDRRLLVCRCCAAARAHAKVGLWGPEISPSVGMEAGGYGLKGKAVNQDGNEGENTPRGRLGITEVESVLHECMSIARKSISLTLESTYSIPHCRQMTESWKKKEKKKTILFLQPAIQTN